MLSLMLSTISPQLSDAAEAWGVLFWVLVAMVGLLALAYLVMVLLLPVFVWRIYCHSAALVVRLRRLESAARAR